MDSPTSGRVRTICPSSDRITRRWVSARDCADTQAVADTVDAISKTACAVRTPALLRRCAHFAF